MKKILFFLFLIFTKLGAEKISLELDGILKTKDQETGEIVFAVYQDEEFKINVKVEDGGRDTTGVEFDKSDLLEIYSRGRNSNIQMINNSFISEILYKYVAIANKVGLIEVGPAFVKNGGKTFESNKVLLMVIKKGEDVAVAPLNSNKKYELFCKLVVDKTNVVEGEPIELSLKIYRRGAVLQVGIQPPQFAGFEIKENRTTFEWARRC
ncbi:MAG: BatD family protein [bacterium]